MSEIMKRMKVNANREIFRLIRIPVVAVLAVLFYRHLSVLEGFEGWMTALQFDLFKAIFGLVLFYIADRILAHGDRAHDLEGIELQIRNAVRIGGAAVVVGLALSGV